MRIASPITSALLAIGITLCACRPPNPNNHTTMSEEPQLPTAARFVDTPLRNRIKLELETPATEVWALVGQPDRMPEYSAGLESVDATRNAAGHCTEYLCHFKPIEGTTEGIDHRSRMVWYAPLHGWASLDEEPNAFGFERALTLITLVEQNGRTLLTWDMHFTTASAEATRMNTEALEQALNDIANNLILRFEGQIKENLADPTGQRAPH